MGYAEVFTGRNEVPDANRDDRSERGLERPCLHKERDTALGPLVHVEEVVPNPNGLVEHLSAVIPEFGANVLLTMVVSARMRRDCRM
jgi:hypothetical protein